MTAPEAENTGILNPVDDPNRRPFGAPGLMYAFFSFVAAVGLGMSANYLEVLPYAVQVLLLFLAAGCFFESLTLMFFEPSVMLGDDVVHYRARKPSIWRTPPRMFRWSGERVDEEFSFSDFQRIEMDYTRVPFPLPVFPFTLPFFRITRWLLTMQRDDGTYYLLEVGPGPLTFRDVANKVSEFTELPLDAPWLNGFDDGNPGSWLWTVEEDVKLRGTRVIQSLRGTGLTFENRDNSLEFPVANRMSTLWKSGGLMVAFLFFVVAAVAVFAGFQYDHQTPAGLLLGMFWMVAGAFVGLLGILLSADYVSPIQSKLCFHEDGLQLVHPMGQSSFIRYDDLMAVRGVKKRSGSASEFGLGKPVPCLEVYSEHDWFFIALHDKGDLDEFRHCFRNLT